MTLGVFKREAEEIRQHTEPSLNMRPHRLIPIPDFVTRVPRKTVELLFLELNSDIDAVVGMARPPKSKTAQVTKPQENQITEYGLLSCMECFP